MEKMAYGGLKSKFLKALAKVPEKIRDEDTIALIDEKPYTWNNASIEIKNDTKIGEKILKSLKEMKII